MATSGSRDVKLTLAVETVGDDGIRQLQSQFAALAKEGADAGPEFQKLADELARLGDQNEALTSFKELAAVTEQLRIDQVAAGEAAQVMAGNLSLLKSASQGAPQAQREAAAAIDAEKKSFYRPG